MSSQLNIWEGGFGNDWMERNCHSLASLNDLYTRFYGITRTTLNEEFLSDLDKSLKVLEVGAGNGNQLLALQSRGFSNLYAIEPNAYGLKLLKERTIASAVKGNAFDIPFKDGFFDLVLTSGLLNDIAHKDLLPAMQEIYRCSNRYIFGYEYFSEKPTTKPYRGLKNVLFKGDYVKLWKNGFPGLTLLKERRLYFLNNDDVTQVFLFEKKSEK